MSFLGAAGAGILAYDWLTSKGQNLTITNNITTKFTIDATTNVTTECFSSLAGSQNVTITAEGGNFTSADPSPCAFCLQILGDIRTARQDLETEAEQLNPSYVPQVANANLETAMVTGQLVSPGSGTPGPADKKIAQLGPCTAMCTDVVVTGVSQSETFTAKQTCNVTNDLSTSVQQTLQGKIQSDLKNQQDIVGQLESEFASNTDQIATNLSQALSQNITQNFSESLSEQMFNTQVLNIKGYSILATNLQQGFNGNQVGSLTVNNTVVDQLRQSAQYSISQSLLNKNDTVGDLSKDFLGIVRTMSDLIDDLATKVLLLIGAVLAGVVVTLGALYAFNKDFHGYINSRLKYGTDEAFLHHRKLRLDPDYAEQFYTKKLAAQRAKKEYKKELQRKA